jgi:hypothetical protein
VAGFAGCPPVRDLIKVGLVEAVETGVFASYNDPPEHPKDPPAKTHSPNLHNAGPGYSDVLRHHIGRDDRI